MANAKKDRQVKIAQLIVFAFIVLLPFGVLLEFNIILGAFEISVHPIDLIAIFSLIYSFYNWVESKKYYFVIAPFIFSAILSLVIASTFYPNNEVAVGFLYLIRLIAYASVFIVVRVLVLNLPSMKKILLESLIAVSAFTAIFGWIQYFWLPDLRTLKLLGWDDHLYRLVGTFLDPAFTGLIIVLGALASFSYLVRVRKFSIFLIFAFLTISLAFTYSRASYLALFTGLVYFLKNKNFVLTIGLFIAIFLFSIPFLPRPSSEGVKLERTHSVYAKVQNYEETFRIFSVSPVFGVGFNTICSARVRMFNDNFSSHSCYGADSSLLFILATTGIVGFIFLLQILLKILKNIDNTFYGDTLKASGIALLVHSQFVGSLTYPWGVGYIALLTAVGIKNKFKD